MGAVTIVFAEPILPIKHTVIISLFTKQQKSIDDETFDGRAFHVTRLNALNAVGIQIANVRRQQRCSSLD